MRICTDGLIWERLLNMENRWSLNVFFPKLYLIRISILGTKTKWFNFKVNGKHVIKSGTDFRYIGQLTLTFDDENDKVTVDVEKITITQDIPEDPAVKAIVEKFSGWFSTSFSENRECLLIYLILLPFLHEIKYILIC